MSRRVAMGKLADGNFGLRISLPGFDANANPPVPQNLVLDSTWPALLPIHQTGVFTFSEGTYKLNFPALSVYPACMVYLQQQGRDGSQAWSYPNVPCDGQIIPSYDTGGAYLQVYVDKSSITTQYVADSSLSETWSCRYVIYKIGV